MYDLIVIGAGSGGVAAARRAGGFGAKVAIVEEREVGGTCVHRGCIPKKLMVYASHFTEDLHIAGGYGWEIGAPEFRLAALRQAVQKELQRLEGVYLTMLEKAGVDLIRGRGRLVDDHTVEVGEKRIQGRNLLIATGGRPFVPDFPGREMAMVSDDLFRLEEPPKRLLIMGSGYIGSEFASIFHAFGSQVTMMFRSPALLPGFDGDVRSTLMESMRDRGVRILCETTIAGCRRTDTGILVVTSHHEEYEFDAVLSATGRHPNVEGLGLETAGVKLGPEGAVVVDGDGRTSVPHIYAVGDVTSRVQLTPVAIAEGRALVETLFNDNPMRVDYCNIPKAVFTLPMVGTVGMSEEEARAKGHEVRIFRTRFRPMKYTLTEKTERVMIKLVVDARTDRVLGVHMVSGDAPETIQAVAVALNAGATKKQFDDTMALHPTAAEELVLLYQPVEG